MPASDDNLPSFKNPPLVETALSVMFKPIKGLGNADLGLFWGSLGGEYPEKVDAEPIEPQIERFGPESVGIAMPQIRLVPRLGASRLQMTKNDGHRMLQIQNGRLAYNWRELGGDTYPRWHEVFLEFKRSQSQFEAFLSQRGLGALDPIQWEVAYVNQFPQGKDWETRSEWHRLIPGLIGQAPELDIGIPEGVQCSWRFALPDERGRLHIDLRHGAMPADDKEALTVQLTARGGVGNKPGFSTDDGLNLGHCAIVMAFTKITGPEAHKRWGRQP